MNGRNSDIGKDIVLSRPIILLMAAASGITVAILYYIHPLLGEIAKNFSVDQSGIGILAMLTQIGYALGMFFLLPLGGAMIFGTFSAFWSTLVFLLESPAYGLGARAAGLFGLVGISGALAASLIGPITDRKSPRYTFGIAIILSTLSYICFLIFGLKIWGLVLGVILLDIGTQSGQISNQARIYALKAEAHNRINTVYMVSYFIGGASGSLLGSYGWGLFGWKGVCAVGLLFQFAAIVSHLRIIRL